MDSQIQNIKVLQSSKGNFYLSIPEYKNPVRFLASEEDLKNDPNWRNKVTIREGEFGPFAVLNNKKNKVEEPDIIYKKEKIENSLPSRQAFMVDLLKHMKNADKVIWDKYSQLLSKEIERLPDMEGRIIKSLEEIKKNLEVAEKNPKSKQTIIDLSKHTPKDVTKFLNLFRDSEGIKYLTHLYDRPGETFVREEVLKKAKDEFNEAKKKYNLPYKLFNRFNAFAFGEGKYKGLWYLDGHKYHLNWYSTQLIEWCKNNPGIHPLNNSDFEQKMIVPFQKSYKINPPELKTLLNKKLSESLGTYYTSFNIEFVDCDKANINTDVDSLLSGISAIFRGIKQRIDKSINIKIVFYRKGRKRFIKIIHIGSESDKPLDVNELFGGDLSDAQKYLYRVCDWSIISNNPDKSVNKLNILYDSNTGVQTKEFTDEAIEGFTHLLTFYAG